MLELITLVGVLSAPLPPVTLVDLTTALPTFNQALWERCIAEENSRIDGGTDEDMERCDRLHDPEGVMNPEEAEDGR